MLLDKSKKYKGIKLLKLDQQIFQNAKRYSRKSSSISIINDVPIQTKKSLRHSVNENKCKNEEDKSPVTYSNITNKNMKKMYSCNKLITKNSNELIFLKNVLKKKGEERKDTEKSLSKFSKCNQPKGFFKKSISCKDLNNLKNNLLLKKSRIINNINTMNSNNNYSINNEFNSNLNIHNKAKSITKEINKENNVNNNGNNINDCKIIKNEKLTDHNDGDNHNDNNKNNKNNIKSTNKFKKLFCCL